MNIAPFSRHIFWSWKPDADLPENVVIQQVIAYGEISDFRLMCKLIPREKINEAIEKWKNRNKYEKHINFLKQVFLHE
jgi:hypothetical protein